MVPRAARNALIPICLAALALALASPASAAPVATDGSQATAGNAPRATARAAAAGEPRLGEQWALRDDEAIGARTAWAQSSGGEVTVAVLDSGADLTHAELAPNLWRNAGEIPGNGADDDRNGWVDDVHGVDVVDGDGTPSDANGHGTHVAGTLAARGDNGVGGSGVAQRARLMIVRVLDADAGGDTSMVARGLDYAVAHGARIVNLSLAGPASSPGLDLALARAEQAGVLVVTAAGNAAVDLGVRPAFPAAAPNPNVIAVAATRQDRAVSSISSFGAPVELAAPGERILSTARGGGYEYRSGTSMAAPHVAGALVLLAAARPDLSADALRDALLAGARPSVLPVSAGALDVAGALRRVVAPAAWDSPAVAVAASPAPKAKKRKAGKKRKRKKRKKRRAVS